MKYKLTEHGKEKGTGVPKPDRSVVLTIEYYNGENVIKKAEGDEYMVKMFTMKPWECGKQEYYPEERAWALQVMLGRNLTIEKVND